MQTTSHQTKPLDHTHSCEKHHWHEQRWMQPRGTGWHPRRPSILTKRRMWKECGSSLDGTCFGRLPECSDMAVTCARKTTKTVAPLVNSQTSSEALKYKYISKCSLFIRRIIKHARVGHCADAPEISATSLRRQQFCRKHSEILAAVRVVTSPKWCRVKSSESRILKFWNNMNINE